MTSQQGRTSSVRGGKNSKEKKGLPEAAASRILSATFMAAKLPSHTRSNCTGCNRHQLPNPLLPPSRSQCCRNLRHTCYTRYCNVRGCRPVPRTCEAWEAWLHKATLAYCLLCIQHPPLLL